MNERSRELIGYVNVNAKIRELAEQAGCSIDRLGYGEGNLEKFAELILEEVMQELFINGYEDAFDHLNKHFGVEE